MTINRKLLFFPALAVGIIVLIIAIKTKTVIPTKPSGDRSRPVETLALKQQKIAPMIIGYGQIKPKYEWKAISEVTGRVVYRNPQLEKGQILSKGTIIIKIDPLDYQLKLAQAETDLISSQTQLKKVTQQQENQQRTLKIELARLKISQKELERKQELRKKGLTSQSELDQQNQSYLSQKKLVQDINNQLALYPSEKKVAEAVVKVNQSKVAEAQRSLDKTTITLPRTMRIAQVDIETNQVVNVQQVMVEGQGIDTMEVEAQISIHDMHLLTASLKQFEHNKAGVAIPDTHQIKAQIELQSGSLTSTWPATLARISETVDPTQATVGVILEIKQDYSKQSPSSNIALVNGMFVKAMLEGHRNPSWVIPERALHGDKVYLLNADNKLHIQPAQVEYRRNNHIIIRGDFNVNDQLILNDILPAIEGMSLHRINAEKVIDIADKKQGDAS